MNEISFHVRHEVTPARVWGVLVAIAEHYSFNHIIQAERQLSRLRQLHLVEPTSTNLTSLGLELYAVGTSKEQLIGDFLHFLHYTQWSPTKPLENTPFWSYRKHCDLLYERVNCTLDSPIRDALTAELNNAINDFFGDQITHTKKGSLSLSSNSLTGIHNWLISLSPSAIENGDFSLRQFSSPELLLLAIGFMINEIELEPGIDILITPEKRMFLGKICMIQDNCLDRIIDWTINLYPQIVIPGTRTGSYGRFIRMIKLPEFKDFI